MDIKLVKETAAKYEGQKVYTVKEAVQMGYTVEPIICSECFCTGEVSYDSVVNDFHCAICGNWMNV